ncbi:ATP-dependent DNA ligase [Paenibacillus periandrae]|uniref:ATP-dependent DNA ligase n=1 Tax=Paenibacillus periandrae TaxID=1761741 RepID=UPI001F093584|nr:ATP-dependent DNA ligase [Paenibacillus periandrae]
MIPKFISPMLLKRTPSPLSSKNFLAEPKIDGIRGLFVYQESQAQLWSRHQTNITNQFPELCIKPAAADSVILDGEVAMYNPAQSDFDFDGVMDRFRLKNELKIKLAAERSPAAFLAWDILFYNGQDLRMLPLYKRKDILNEILVEHSSLSKVISIPGIQGLNLANQIMERDWEGCVFKEIESSYQTGKRSDQWLKWLNYKSKIVYITGIRKKKFGWMLGSEHAGKLQPAGLLELGTSEVSRSEVWQLARKSILKEDSSFYYLEPDIKIQVKYVRLTRNGYMRTPSFQRIC